MARRAADHRPGRGIADGRPSGVCLLSGEFPPDPGGVGDYTARLAEALAALGVPVGVLTTARLGRPARGWHGSDNGVSAASFPIEARIAAWGPRSWPPVLRALPKLGRSPLLHIQYQTGAFDLQAALNLLPLWVRAILPRARVVTTFHDFRVPYIFPKAGPLRVGANRLLARGSHAAIFTESADLAAAGPSVRGHLIPIGSNVDCVPPSNYDRDLVRRRLGADSGTVLVGYFGFLNQSKGVPTLLGALSALLADGRDVRLAMIGGEAGGSDPSDAAQARVVRELIARLGLCERVATTGYLRPMEVSAALLACDLLALPFADGASLRRGTLMAGFAHGLPIVSTTPLGGARPVSLRDGEHLLLVPPGDPTALAGAIARLADDTALRAHLVEGARAIADAVRWPSIARRTLAVYRSTFADNPDRRRGADR